MAKAKKSVPEGFTAVTPMLTLDQAAKAIDWYQTALGAQVVSVNPGPDGKIMHAEIRVAGAPIMLHDAMMGSKGPLEMGGSPASLWLFVDDCDALFKRAIDAGGKETMAMADQFWGDRCGMLTDPFGYGWAIATRKEDLTPAELEQRQTQFFKTAGK